MNFAASMLYNKHREGVMRTYIITYDITDDDNRTELLSRIRYLYVPEEDLRSSYIVKTSKKSCEIIDDLKSFVDSEAKSTDKLLVAMIAPDTIEVFP